MGVRDVSTGREESDASQTRPLAGTELLALEELREMGHEMTFGPGDAIFEAGDRADAMFVVLEGEAEVDVGGRSHRLGRGAVFGEMALISPDTRMATVRALGPVRAVRVEADTFRSLLAEKPEVGIAVLRMIILRLREVEERIDAWMAP
jgi:CRP-like cAMP-binding protein